VYPYCCTDGGEIWFGGVSAVKLLFLLKRVSTKANYVKLLHFVFCFCVSFRVSFLIISFLLIRCLYVCGLVMLKQRKTELRQYSALYSEMTTMSLLEKCSCRFVALFLYEHIRTAVVCIFTHPFTIPHG